MVGSRLLCWYDEDDDTLIEYLFGLDQFRLLGKPGSEEGGECRFETHQLIYTPHYLGTTECEIFSQIFFVCYGYFYDLDHEWYYINPGPFRLKMPLRLIENNLNDKNYEFDFLIALQKKILHYIFYDYGKTDREFESLLGGMDIDEIYQGLIGSAHPMNIFCEKYKDLFSYFDDWIVIRCDEECVKVTNIIMKKKSDNHVETIEW